jgi:hypothetical protein
VLLEQTVTPEVFRYGFTYRGVYTTLRDCPIPVCRSCFMDQMAEAYPYDWASRWTEV